MAKGDVLFYHGDNDLQSRIIRRWTNGPYSHVEIDIGDGLAIGAWTTGINKHPLVSPTLLIQTSLKMENIRLEAALIWLNRQVGEKYGWVDNLNSGLQKFLPNGPFLQIGHQYNCSDLATRFLWIAGYPLDGDFLDSDTVNPSELAKALLNGS